MPARIPLDHAQIAAFCQKWQITEFALFGSVLRDDFRSDSDVDVLVTFAPGVPRRYDDWLQMLDELQALFGREVDLVERPIIERSPNYISRQLILHNAEVVHAN